MFLFVVVVGLLACQIEAKRKRKFEGDFEFAEEVSDFILVLLARNACSGTGPNSTVFFVTLSWLICK